MALPLPEQFSQQPGGGIAAAMNGLNAMQSGMYDTMIKNAQARYAPLTTLADAASKMTYSNLMGPQFLSKIMEHPDLLANIPEDQKQPLLNHLLGVGAFNPLSILQGQQQQGQGNPLGNLVSNIKNAFGFGSSQSPSMNAVPQQQSNALMQSPNLSDQDRMAINSFQPGQSYVVQGNNPKQQATPLLNSQQQQPKTFAENAGDFGGVKSQGVESGKIRAEDVKEFGNIIQAAQQQKTILDDLGKVLQLPAIESIRQTPYLGHQEMSYYAQNGTKAQQDAVGRYYTDMGKIVQDTLSQFKGSVKQYEIPLINSFKPSPGDTVEVARAKTAALSYLNQMLTQRTAIAAKLEDQGHLPKYEALQQADKQLNGDAVRAKINNDIFPQPSEQDIKDQMKAHNRSRSDVISAYRRKGYALEGLD